MRGYRLRSFFFSPRQIFCSSTCSDPCTKIVHLLQHHQIFFQQITCYVHIFIIVQKMIRVTSNILVQVLLFHRWYSQALHIPFGRREILSRFSALSTGGFLCAGLCPFSAVAVSELSSLVVSSEVGKKESAFVAYKIIPDASAALNPRLEEIEVRNSIQTDPAIFVKS